LPRLFASLPEGMPVLLVDHESTDATAQIARAHRACVVTRRFDGFVNARRFAIAQVETPWTLMIDADERLDDALRDAILAARDDVDGYVVSRTTYYRGKPLRIWRGERLLRLFRTNRARLEASPAAGGQAELHERWICDGATRTLAGTLEHYSYLDAASYRAKYERYTDIEARGVRPGLDAAVLLQTALTPARFLRLLLKGAALDGPDGWYVAWKSALYPAVVQWKALRRS
jgi:glycosyltransferase involved in cell wall biosynthesis